MRVPDNLDLYEMHEREQARLERRREAIERLEEENREERDNEKRIASPRRAAYQGRAKKRN